QVAGPRQSQKANCHIHGSRISASLPSGRAPEPRSETRPLFQIRSLDLRRLGARRPADDPLRDCQTLGPTRHQTPAHKTQKAPPSVVTRAPSSDHLPHLRTIATPPSPVLQPLRFNFHAHTHWWAHPFHNFQPATTADLTFRTLAVTSFDSRHDTHFPRHPRRR